MSLYTSRSQHMYKSWYRSSYKLEGEEYQYIGYLCLTCIVAWGLGLVVGVFWASVL